MQNDDVTIRILNREMDEEMCEELKSDRLLDEEMCEDIKKKNMDIEQNSSDYFLTDDEMAEKVRKMHD